MRLMRYGARDGAKTPVVLDAAGQARDVSSLVADFTPETIETLRQTLDGVDLEGLPLFEAQGQRIAAPVGCRCRPSRSFLTKPAAAIAGQMIHYFTARG